MARLAKRYYGHANHVWLVKRVLSFVGSRVVPIGGVLTGMDCKRPLIVTDDVLVKFGLVE